MTLELCESGSLMDMLRRRRRFTTECKARFFIVKLIGAHASGHPPYQSGRFRSFRSYRKSGRKKEDQLRHTPEVLLDTANGHSFEVDTLSIGVILYTLLVGRQPFQTKDVKTIYKCVLTTS
jgi:cell cycle serine/threonine-protein kinase CDC5/MSD2